MTQKQKSFKIQAFAGSLVVLGYLFTQDKAQMMSALYGYFVGLVVLMMLVFAMKRADSAAKEDPKRAMLILYLAAVIRFVILAVLFIVGMSHSALALDPLAVVLPFIVMQVSQAFNLKGKKRLTD